MDGRLVTRENQKRIEILFHLKSLFLYLEKSLFFSNYLQYSLGHCVSGHLCIYSRISRNLALAIDTDTSALP